MKTTDEKRKALESIIDSLIIELAKLNEPEYDLNKGDTIHYPLDTGEIRSDIYLLKGRPVLPFESKNRQTIECAQKLIELQNWADKYNEVLDEIVYFIDCECGITVMREEYTSTFEVLFSSEEIAFQAIEHFGKDYFKR